MTIDVKHMTQVVVKIKTTTLKSSLCDNIKKQAFVKATKVVVGQGTDAEAIAVERNNKQITF